MWACSEWVSDEDHSNFKTLICLPVQLSECGPHVKRIQSLPIPHKAVDSNSLLGKKKKQKTNVCIPVKGNPCLVGNLYLHLKARMILFQMEGKRDKAQKWLNKSPRCRVKGTEHIPHEDIWELPLMVLEQSSRILQNSRATPLLSS